MSGDAAKLTAVHAPQATVRFGTSSRCVVEPLKQYAVLDQGSHAKRFTDAVFGLDQASLAAVLRGLFTADGTVANYGSHSHHVALDSSSIELLEQVQLLLLSFGVKSKLYRDRRDAGTEMLPNGNGGEADPEQQLLHQTRSGGRTEGEGDGLIGTVSVSLQ